MLLSEEDAAKKGEACSFVYLARDALGLGADALGGTVAVRKLGCGVTPIEAWVRYDNGRYLDAWYNRLRVAFLATMADLGVHGACLVMTACTTMGLHARKRVWTGRHDAVQIVRRVRRPMATAARAHVRGGWAWWGVGAAGCEG
ncbi:hypothetical protein GCM10014715_88730 [Streptomyces spiralis]|uniref:Uncharacterized protein n=1 Tax=Streptomyces spiralis TaxID=66376 RepID=A0A919E7M2_9ACTN|nr:hypothetical protein [Streptomyces spiralis]GHF20561.1 hypothetical protein GCM10014715_88730 [Streptomyces spiralis]